MIKKTAYIAITLVFSFILYQITIALHTPPATAPLILDQVYENAPLKEQLLKGIETQPFNLYASLIFALAILHTFFARKITSFSKKLHDYHIKKGNTHPETFWVEILRFLGEVEVIFGIWVIPLLILMAYFYDWKTAVDYLSERSYTESLFVVVIMALASTKPVIDVAENAIRRIASLGNQSVTAWWWSILTFGPLTGSLITEPAAMTISALLLTHQFYDLKPTLYFRYATLGLLFTNISVGGTLTHFAAPPVIMVSKAWGWDTPYMFKNFGLKAVIGIVLANTLYYLIFRKDFRELEIRKKEVKTSDSKENSPFWISLVHLFFLAWIVVHSHYPAMVVGTFLIFLGFYKATIRFQDKLDLKMPILVGFFLAGLVIHGSLQGWWISPLLSKGTFETLMVLSLILTAFNDNAAITFLASLNPSFTETFKYAVMAGAITGGGLTVIANAPNLPGQTILGKQFPNGVSVLYLFLGALAPTIIVGLCFYLFII